MKGHNAQLSSLEGEFLKASQNVKKQERLRWATIAGVGAMLLVTIVFAVTGKLNRFIYQPVDMEDYWVTIPAGEFLMGSSDKEVAEALIMCSDCDFSDEQPQNLVNLAVYQIGKYEVTNRQYAQCVKAGICSAPNNKTYTVQKYELHPVIDVSWYDANTYCGWAGGRLPTEAEWEKAARGTNGRTYPWGEDISCDRVNYQNCVGDTTPVGNYESGKSLYGVYDMAGNVWEWTSSLYQPYPYDALDGREDMSSSDNRVFRGGSWYNGSYLVRSACRDGYLPSSTYFDIGFRCARSLP